MHARRMLKAWSALCVCVYVCCVCIRFETNYVPRVTPAALGSPCVDRDYYKCWTGLKSHFTGAHGAANGNAAAVDTHLAEHSDASA